MFAPPEVWAHPNILRDARHDARLCAQNFGSIKDVVCNKLVMTRLVGNETARATLLDKLLRAALEGGWKGDVALSPAREGSLVPQHDD